MRAIYHRMLDGVWTTVRQEDGATMVEYGLMILLIAAAAVTAVTSLGTIVSSMFTAAAGLF